MHARKKRRRTMGAAAGHVVNGRRVRDEEPELKGPVAELLDRFAEEFLVTFDPASGQMIAQQEAERGLR